MMRLDSLGVDVGAGAGRLATPPDLLRTGAAERRRLSASRFNWFTACSGTPSHCLPQGPGQGIVSAKTSRKGVAACDIQHSLSGGCATSGRVGPAVLSPCRRIGIDLL